MIRIVQVGLGGWGLNWATEIIPQVRSVALVGCGRISKTHFEALKKVDGLSITAVCDIDATRAQAAGEAHGVPWYRTLDEMLKTSGPEIDIVSICTPSGCVL